MTHDRAPSRIERSRRQILDAAIVEFEADGVDGASMEAIAPRAGLTRATLYNLFSGKEEMAEMIIGRQVGSWDAHIRQGLREGLDPLGLIVEALRRNAETCLAYPRIALAALSSPGRRAPAEAGGAYPSFRLLIADLVRAAQTNGQLRDDMPAESLMLILMGLHVQALLYAIVTQAPATPEAIASLVRTICEGIGPRMNR